MNTMLRNKPKRARAGAPASPAKSVVIGIDVGGTFTDIVLMDTATGRIASAKVPTTPEDQSIGFVAGIRQILQQNGIAPPSLHEADTDWVNDAGKPFLLAMPPRQLADLAVAITEAVDRKIEALPDDFVARNAAAGHPLNLRRAEHRREHFDQIEAAQ